MKLVPNTTLAAETGNNTPLPDSYAGLSNHVPKWGNVSTVSILDLLYPGVTTKVFSHMMPWWHKDGSGGHPIGKQIGYDSTDPAQVDKQGRFLMDRGVMGVMIDWYGRGQTSSKKWEDDCTLAWKAWAEAHAPFQFAIILDCGAYKDATDMTAELIADMKYCVTTYLGSPAYYRPKTNPWVGSFGDSAYNIDWAKVKASLPPIDWSFRNPTGFTHAISSGAYNWVGYFDEFYKDALANPTKIAVGSANPGFDDSLASWGTNRYLDREQGQRWLDEIALVNKYFSTTVQLPSLELITENDYEEGTAIEPGIDAGLAVTLSVTGSILSWTASGNQNAIHHFDVYGSTDGTNLQKLQTLSATTFTFDTVVLGLDAGAYQFFIKAVGKPFIQNAMSNPVTASLGTATPMVMITSPKNGTTSASPVKIDVATQGGATAIELWVDGVKKGYESGAMSYSWSVDLSIGQRRITAVGHFPGQTLKTSVYVTVK